MPTGKPILIVGAHGTVGRPVVRRLVEDGFAVRALARDSAKAAARLPAAVDVRTGDLADPATIDAALDGCAAVYLSVETPPDASFKPETDGLRNVIAAAKNHGTPRLLVLSALGVGDAPAHPWWHLRLKVEAQRLTRASGLAWTLFEPTWFAESLALFCKGGTFWLPTGARLEPYWIAGDDYGRIVSAALTKNAGIETVVPAQGERKLPVRIAAEAFVMAYDPAIRIRPLPLWLLKLGGLVKAEARELATLLSVENGHDEPAPDPGVWETFAKPRLTVADYADYARRTGDFPQK